MVFIERFADKIADRLLGEKTPQTYSIGSFKPNPSFFDISNVGRRAQVPDWFYSSPFGQPRGVDIAMLRELSQTPWPNLCISNIIAKFSGLRLEAQPKDKNEYSEENLQKAKDFIARPNSNNEPEINIRKKWARDILTIDAGVINKVFSDESYLGKFVKDDGVYVKKMVPQVVEKKEYYTYKEIKKVKETKEVKVEMPVLKERGKRELVEIFCHDGSTFLPDADYTGIVRMWYQYSWKVPRKTPIMFDPDEIIYSMLNPQAKGFFGFSAMQSIEDMTLTLKAQLLHNLGFFNERAIPDGLLTIVDASDAELDDLAQYFKKEFKGRTNRFGFIAKDVKFTPLTITNRDMQFINSQQWFMKLTLASFHINIPILSLGGSAPKAGTESLVNTEYNDAIMPLVTLYEYIWNNEILPELGCEDIKVSLVTKDLEKDRKVKELYWGDLKMGVTTINEVRQEILGKDPVAWGNMPFNPNMLGFVTSEEPPSESAKKMFSEGDTFARTTNYDMKKWIGWDYGAVSVAVIKFLLKYNFPLITDVTKSQIKKIREILINAFQNNMTVFQTVQAMKEVLDDEIKAERIVRTETIRAANMGQLESWKEKGIKQVKWIAVPGFAGGRTCEKCLSNNGKIYYIDDAINENLIPAHVNCRCTFAAVVG